MAKEVKLKCGHTISTLVLKPFKSETGRWMLKGYEKDCDRMVKVSLSVKSPTVQTLNKWGFNGIAKSLDGCTTEPDGTCQHGFPSWLLALGYI